MGQFTLIAALFWFSSAVSAQNICPSISEGTYNCVLSDSRTVALNVAHRTTEGGEPALYLTAEKLGNELQIMPCVSGRESIEICSLAQGPQNSEMPPECKDSFGNSLYVVKKLITASDLNRISKVESKITRGYSKKNPMVLYKSAGLSLVKVSESQFKLEASFDSISLTENFKESWFGQCTKI